uniref:Uncharacterized protein n=1 Tax=Amphimedon queenslandica TaxID=400682 RepID=A0A1X7V268_AMPQE
MKVPHKETLQPCQYMLLQLFLLFVGSLPFQLFSPSMPMMLLLQDVYRHYGMVLWSQVLCFATFSILLSLGSSSADGAKAIFEDTNISITTEGRTVLGSPIGTSDYINKYVESEVSDWN